ncbi:MAG TPA: restriction endonuclease [Candidatus Angelobacter sp.]|nr:restriction endonuclease [Candidatus Angelobacter sp.]
MLNAVDSAGTADAKGAALEELAMYLFEKVRGVECSGQNILDAPRAHELDLAFWNDQRLSLLYFLDAILIVECKASDSPVGSAEVGWFVRKLQDRGAHHGVLVALNGVTGDGDRSAHSEILSALVRDSIKILLLTRVEILALDNTDQLAAVLKRKMLRLTLNRAVHAEEE